MRRDWTLRPPAAELAARYFAAGHWTDAVLPAVLDDALAAAPGLELRVWSDVRPHRGTIRGVGEVAGRVAAALRARGVVAGDVVALQLPNWAEAAATFWAAARLGAVIVPIPPFYGPRELGFILAQSGAKVLVTADRFRHLDYIAALDEIRRRASHLETIVIVGAAPPGTIGFDALVASAEPLCRASSGGRRTDRGTSRALDLHRDPNPNRNPDFDSRSHLHSGSPLDPDPNRGSSSNRDGDLDSRPGSIPDPDTPALIAYTSGTTADPKGVIHTHRSLVAEIRQLAALQAPGDLPTLTGAPLGHFIGMLSGLFLPLVRRRAIHLIDAWVPARVLDAMIEGNVAAGSGATYFLTSLLDDPHCGPAHHARMRHVGLGGAPVPAAVADRAEALGISVIRSFGSSEQPSITGSTHADPPEKRKYTDGSPLPGVEIRLVDEAGGAVAPGAPGEILSRGPDLFWGYTDPALTASAIDAEGWYATGDIGVLDAHGWLTIVDRKKDIIIRGGENVSAGEVEELLARMPGVAEVAVVAAPDVRLGEHGCAFIRAAPGAPAPALAAVRAHLERLGLARPKWPEEIREIAEFPRTPSGKIKKFVLREQLRDEATGRTAS